LQNGYGMTESTAGIAATRNPVGSPDISVGQPLPGVEVAIDAPGPDGVGEVLTRGAHVMRGYFEAPKETASTLCTDGFLRTGDLGRMDPDGRLTIVGRAKEMIIRSGFNVYPQEVEAALNQHPAVALAAVVGRTVAGNEEVLAFVQTDDTGLTEAILVEFVAERITAYKRPSRIIVTEKLPAAATGKILKHQLIAAFADQLA
jgi:acyl-CoA synthetase (AMP-forming)/AMP-acid ligase II